MRYDAREVKWRRRRLLLIVSNIGRGAITHARGGIMSSDKRRSWRYDMSRRRPRRHRRRYFVPAIGCRAEGGRGMSTSYIIR